MQVTQGSLELVSVFHYDVAVLCASMIFAFSLGLGISFYLCKRFKPHRHDTYQFKQCTQHRQDVRQQEQEQNLAFTSYQIKSVIKSLINSQYVLKDRESFNSLYQTPLRHSIHKLRVISESLLNQDVVSTSQFTEPSECGQSDIGAVLQAQIDLAGALTNKDKVTIKLQNNTSQNALVNAPDKWLGTAIQELLFNAIKHNPQGVEIACSLGIANEHAIVRFCDFGRGIPHALTQGFSEYSKATNTVYRRKSDKENLINLPLIQEKAQALGGNLIVKSARGFMTQIELWLPLAQQEAAAGSGQMKTELPCIAATNSATPRLLWVRSDDKENAETYSSLKRQYILQTASSIEQGFSFIAKFKPDCILIDAEMQITSTLIAKKWMQLSGTFSDIPVVALGGLLDKSAQLTALQVGVSAVVEKPIIQSELSSVIATVIEEKIRLVQRVEEVIALYHSNSLQHFELKNGPADRFFEQFNALLEEHFHDDAFRLAQAAEIMNTTDKTLSRKLAKYYDSGFCELLKKYRLGKAKALIVKGERISHVAYDTGFSSPSYFTQCFRAEFGFAPSMLSKK